MEIPLLSQPHWAPFLKKPLHGICIPLFYLKSCESEGIGDYNDLIHLINWCATTPFNIIQLLPLNDTGDDSSPYSAISSFALNPIYLHLARLPHFDEYQQCVERLHLLKEKEKEKRVHYLNIKAEKEHLLNLYLKYELSHLRENALYQDFIKKNYYWLHYYALFKVIKSFFPQPFRLWPLEFQNAAQAMQHPLLQDSKELLESHYAIQFFCHQQLKQAKEAASEKNIFLKGDLPILISQDSADAWAYPYLFNTHMEVGAPPDQYSQEGQNWGFPLYRWKEHFTHDFSWWHNRLKVAQNFYHLYRLDHIAGLFRLWTISPGKKATEGHYTPSHESEWQTLGNQILDLLLQFSLMLPIGEDLGTIPSCVRDTMQAKGICGTKIIRWEKNWSSGIFTSLKEYPPFSMTSVSTHDSSLLESWWKEEIKESQQFAHQNNIPWEKEFTKTTRHAVLSLAHRSKSLFHINLFSEYLGAFPELSYTSQEERINEPGVIAPSNWSIRMKTPIEIVSKHSAFNLWIHSLCAQSSG